MDNEFINAMLLLMGMNAVSWLVHVRAGAAFTTSILIGLLMIYSERANAQELHVSFPVAVVHTGAEADFTEGVLENPGIGFGVEWESPNESWVYGMEAGWFIDSYSEGSTYVEGYVMLAVIDASWVTLYAGAGASFAEYPNLVGFAQDRGLPVIGNHILIPGLRFKADFGRTALVTRLVFGGDKFDMLATVSLEVTL